ncbi:YodL domain-containing protein [Bacillus sp. DTU_2020_1000418_1_SI_GHA_SEK_038]|uniref:YodL domain-containing protein n=1 Tax=Bacillus sp. DTU_2020_1000418_1_SI_GHA_SEK_038 TaxID=3077585 RepID=UPI0028EE70E9|nr:YodL domain-containing protein [Bacillus sp. DTU_2020_1000418_1_SI_GHA_SEK_038]WNS77604.1 YodL domain-containing protein [Bacillus sp. DTU_2020_1000418_1_SI_GHA_SEK_038]
MLKELTRVKRKEYDVTIFQTPEFRQNKGYRQVYRLTVEASDHDECIYSVFSTFNVHDRIPNDFNGRFISTGDILYIDEGRKGQYYFQLKPGGWQEINRIHIR